MKRLLFLMFLLGLTIAVNSQIMNNIVAYWKLDGNASDASGSNTGTVIGATADSQGKISSAYSFDGTDDYVSVPNSTSLNIQGNTISLSAWIKPSEIKTQMIVSKIREVGTHTSPYFQYNLQLYGASTTLYPRFCLSINGTIYYAAKSTLNLTLNQWHHVVGTYDGTNLRLYLNGSQVDTTAISGNITAYSTPMYLGVNGALGEAFSGLIDEVGIWNRTLGATEVTSLYNLGSGSSFPFINNTYNLTTSVSPSNGGTITVSPLKDYYNRRDTVLVYAIANDGFVFSDWNNNLTQNPMTIVMGEMGTDENAMAVFSAVSLPSVPTVTTTPITPITPNSAQCGGTIESNGGSGILKQGICWSTSTNNPTIEDNKTIDHDAIPGMGFFISSLSNLMERKTYYVRAYATNSAGTGYGEQFTFTTGYSWKSKGNNIYYNSGNVGIGTTTPTVELTVNGKILAKEVEVVSSISSDYVFEPAYELMPLTEVEKYVKQNKHLPGVPSAVEFSKTGQNLAKTEDILLRKIEELTLYLFQLKKENEEMKIRLEILEKSK